MATPAMNSTKRSYAAAAASQVAYTRPWTIAEWSALPWDRPGSHVDYQPVVHLRPPAPTNEPGQLPVPKPPQTKGRSTPRVCRQRVVPVPFSRQLREWDAQWLEAVATGRVATSSRVPAKDRLLLLSSRKAWRSYLKTGRIPTMPAMPRVATPTYQRGGESYVSRPAQATSVKQVKRRTPSWRFERQSPELFERKAPPTPREAPVELVRRLRAAILLLEARRKPRVVGYTTHFVTPTRSIHRPRTNLDAYIRHMAYCERNPIHTAEGDMWVPKIEIGASAQKMLDDLVGKIEKAVAGAKDALTQRISTNIAGVAMILVTAAAGKTRAGWITGIISSLALTGIIHYGSVFNIAGPIATAAAKKPESTSGHTAEGNLDTPMDARAKEEEENQVATGLTLLVQGIGTYCGVKSDIAHTDRSIQDWAKVCTKNLQFNSRSTYGLFSFFKAFINMLKSVAKWVFLKFNPTAEPMITFWEHSKVMAAVMKECDELVTMLDTEFEDSNNMARLDAALMIISEIIVRIGSFDAASNGATLLSYCTTIKMKLLNKRTECNKLGYSSSTCVTPYALYFTGAPGLGKSTCLNSIAWTIAEACGVKDGLRTQVYSRRPGKQFWDGHSNQQMVVYDDFAQFRTADYTNSDIAELFALITDQPFRPNFAEVNNKGRIVDVKLVLCASNLAHPKATFLSDEKALWRRRNMLVRVEGTPLPKNSKFDPEFNHLSFSCAGVVDDAANPKWGPPMKYRDLCAVLDKDARAYMAAEQSKLAHRLKESAAIVPKDRKTPLSLEGLEAALIEVIAAKGLAEQTSQFYSPTTYKARLQQWLRNHFPYMYKSNDEDIECENAAELLDEKLAVSQIQQVPITADNFCDYLTPGAWSLLSEAQREDVKKFFTTAMPDAPWVEPKFHEANAESDVNASTSSAPPPKTVKKPLTPQEIEQQEQAVVNGKKAAYKLVCNDPPKDGRYLLDDTQFIDADWLSIPFFNFPFTNHVLTQWMASERTIARKEILALIKYVDGAKCSHKHCNPGSIDVHMDHGYVVRTEGKRNFFGFYKCDAKHCILNSQSVLRVLRVYSPGLYWAMKAFAKSSSKQQDAGVSPEMIPEIQVNIVKRFMKLAKDAFKKFKPILTRGLRVFWTLLKWLLMLIVPIGACIGALFMWRAWKPSKEESDGSLISTIKAAPPHIKQQCMEAWASAGRSVYRGYDGIPAMGEAAYTIAPRHPGGNTLSPQHIARGNVGQEDNLYPLFKQATAFIDFYGEDRTTREVLQSCMRVFRPCGQYVLMLRHYWAFMSQADPDTIDMKITIGEKTWDMNIRSLRIFSITNSEIIAVYCPQIPRARDMRPHLISWEAWERAPVPSDMKMFEHGKAYTNVHTLSTKLVNTFRLKFKDDIMITLPEAITYSGFQGNGKCMSILIDNQCRIRGFHIAGTSRNGYSQIVARSMLDGLGDVYNVPEIPYLSPVDNPSLNIDTAVLPVGTAEMKYTVHNPTATAIRPSEIHGVFPIRTLPAPLKACAANEYTDPLWAGVRKHGLPPKGFDSHDLRVGEQRFTEMLVQNVKPPWADVKVRSMEMAIAGIPGAVGYKPIVLSTSEGFPFMCNRKGSQTSKRWLIHQHIGEDNEITFGIHEQLQNEYEKNQALRKQGIIPPTIFVDCLKDARLPLEKVNIPGKVRIFSVAPTDFVIAYRQYFADFMVGYMDARFNMCHAIGIAPERDDWTDLVRHLTQVGSKFLCGDYKNFGPGFDNGVYKAVHRAALEWYRKHNTENPEQFAEDQQVREIMQIELSEPTHIARDTLYRTFSGMCSGSPSTTPDNSEVNTMYIFIAWYHIMSNKKPTLASFDAMMRHLRVVTYGDDVIMCVSDEAVEHFNNVTLHHFFKTYGIEYTDARKTGVIEPWCTLEDATFLKRYFRPHPYHGGTFLGALDKVSIEDCANWINKTIDVRSASLEASYACLQLAYGWGPTYFKQVRNALMEAWFQKKVIFTPRTWNDYELMYRGCDKVSQPIYIGVGDGPPTSTPGESTSCEESKDTIIQDHAPPDQACPVLTRQHIIDWAGADYDASYERVINRYVLLDTLPWSATKNRGDLLSETVDKVERTSAWSLPVDLLTVQKNSPTVMPFFQHKYANFDMDLKIVVNSNKFMVGQLLASWYYLHREDDGHKFRTNVISESQMLHGLIDAGASNSIEMCVPYKNYRPWIHLMKDDSLGHNACMGKLTLRVLSSLVVPSTSHNTCSVSVYVRFKNGNFMGVIPRDLSGIAAEGDMLPMLTTMAAGYLMQRAADANRDKPPVQLPPVHMQPMATGSLAVGTGCSEPLAALRLDARGQCPHPDVDSTSMSLLWVAQQTALYASFDWQDTDPAGKSLWRWDVTPTPPYDSFNDVVIRNASGAQPAIVGRTPPPISVIAGMMCYWRGSIQVDFSVIASQYHTGRLLICFSPFISSTLTLKQAQSLPYVVFDIHDERAFSFVTPYIADKPWWPCGYLNGQVDEPGGIGTLHVFVLNALIPMDSVAKKIEVLVWLKAAPSFEVSVPRQPVWGLPWNIDIHDPDVIRARDGYAPWYGGGWRYVVAGARYVLRYGNVTDHIAQFSGLEFGVTGAAGGWYYYALDATDYNYAVNAAIVIGNLQLGACAFIPIDVGDGYGRIYMGIIRTGEIGVGSGKIFPGKFDGKSQPNYTKLMALSEETAYVAGNPKLKRLLFPNPPALKDLQSLSDSSGAGDILSCEPTPNVKPTGCGMDLFGESFADGKDFLRRYEPLYRIPINIATNTIGGNFAIALDCLPAGYDVPISSPYAQTARDGGQALLASAFRFFRGSMNFKFVVNSSDVAVWIEHRPDRKYYSSMYRPAGLTDRDHRWTKNYAQNLTLGSVNQSSTINVPFYQMGTAGLLQRPVKKTNEYALRAYSLGELLIGVEPNLAPKDMKYTVLLDVLKAMGDDMRFYTYTGFPILVYIGELLAKK